MKLSKLRAANATRQIAGQAVPRMNTTSGAMRSAMKAAHGAGWAGGGDDVEGEMASPRLDRPGRKAGGRVMMSKERMAEDKLAMREGKKAQDMEKVEERKSGGRVGAWKKEEDASGGDREGRKAQSMERPERKNGGFLGNLKEGSLRKALHVKEGKNIPEKTLETAEKSDDPAIRKKAVLAENMKHWKKG